MHWFVYSAYFLGGLFAANCIPHLVNGISGRPFQTPFAHPPGKGLSSSVVNVVWGLFNLMAAYCLVLHVGSFDPRSTVHALSVGAGFSVLAVLMARHFGRVHRGM